MSVWCPAGSNNRLVLARQVRVSRGVVRRCRTMCCLRGGPFNEPPTQPFILLAFCTRRQAAVLALLGGVGDALGDRVADLADQRRQLASQRKRVTAELRLEERKRKRLVAKSRALSNEDLMAIMAGRAQAQAKAKAKAKGKAKAKA